MTLTANGLLLGDPAGPLAEAGLDSLDPERYRYLGGPGALPRVIPGLKAAYRSRLPSLKVNRVPQAQTPPGDILADIAREREIRVRLIGLMPMGPGASLPRPIDNDGVPKLP
ncbi:MAG: hypothetical protein LBF58_08330, partial [Deltaproteobacteria bacterium]|nr:hypothetical protein [Deltaproteobacteria bacterium]